MKKKYKLSSQFLIAFLGTVISGIVTHCSILWLETIAPDSLATGLYKTNSNWEMTLGRWGIQLLENIRGGIVNETIILLVSLIFLGLGTVIICKILKLKNTWEILLIAILIGTAPQFSETFMYIYAADSYTLSFLLSSLSAYMLINMKDKKIFLPLGILFGVLSLSLYQAYIAITVVLILIYSIRELLIKNSNIKKIILNLIQRLLFVFASMVIYLILTKVILFCNGLNFSDYKGASNMNLGTIISNLPVTIIRTYLDFNNYLFGETIIYNAYWHRNIINILLCAMSAIGTVYILFKNQNVSFSKIFLLLVFILIMPMCINLMDIIMPNTQTNLVTGPALLSIYFYFIMLISNLNSNVINKFMNYIKYGVYALLMILCYTYVMSDNATYYSRNDVYKNYYTISNDILHLVHNLDGYERGMKWCFTDNIRYKSEFTLMSNGMIANDYETWDNLDGIWSTWGFYHRYLGIDLYMVDKDTYYEVVENEKVKNMPVYPSKDSVQILDGVVVIKISNNYYKKQNV